MKRKPSVPFVQAEAGVPLLSGIFCLGISKIKGPVLLWCLPKVQCFVEKSNVEETQNHLRQYCSSQHSETGSNSILWLVFKFFLMSEKASHLIFPQLSYASLQNLFQHEV